MTISFHTLQYGLDHNFCQVNNHVRTPVFASRGTCLTIWRLLSCLGLSFRVVILNNEMRHGHEDTSGRSGRFHGKWVLWLLRQSGQSYAIGHGRANSRTSRWFAVTHSKRPWTRDENGTLECGPWYIVGLISKEEIASWDGTIAKNERQRFNPLDGRPESTAKRSEANRRPPR